MDARSRIRQTSRKLRKLWLVSRQASYRSALRHGVAAAVEHERVPFRHDFQSIVDVGAGRGQFALVARHLFPTAKLHCFEPLTEARRKLAAVLADARDVQIHGVALGSRSGRGQLHVSKNLDSSSLLPMTSSHLTAFPGSAEKALATVPIARLDDVLSIDELASPSLLKIDVQGYELEVLRAATDVMSAFDTVLVECSFVELYSGQPPAEDLICHLREHGFRLAGVFSIAYDGAGRTLQADLLFERKGKSPTGTDA